MPFFAFSNESWALTWRDIPAELGVSGRVAFRPLTGDQLDLAKDNATARAMATLAQLRTTLGDEALNGLQSDASRSGNTPDPLNSYDKQVLIDHGVAEWEIANPHDGTPVPCTRDTKRDLDAAARDWLARTVLELNVRDEGNA